MPRTFLALYVTRAGIVPRGRATTPDEFDPYPIPGRTRPRGAAMNQRPRLIALVTALIEALTMFASMPTPHTVVAPT